MENVKCLTKDPNPWTKSFRVSVPARFEEAMSNPKMYLGTWEARPFTQWPSSRQLKGRATPQQEGLMVEAATTAPAAGGAPKA